MRQMFLFSYSKWQPWNCISLQMATLWLHAGVQMRIIYSSSLSSRLGSGLRAQMLCTLIAVSSFYLLLPPPSFLLAPLVSFPSFIRPLFPFLIFSLFPVPQRLGDELITFCITGPSCHTGAFCFCFKLTSVWMIWYLWRDPFTYFDHLFLCCCDTPVTCPGRTPPPVQCVLGYAPALCSPEQNKQFR